MRVGIGYDIRPFTPGGVLVLGGVKIPGAWGLRGRSDGDVVLHAVIDALLGAASLGGYADCFSVDDPEYIAAPSAVLVAETLRLLQERELLPAHVDVTVIIERPSLEDHRDAIAERLGSLLRLAKEHIGVKAVSPHGMGPLGDGKGIAAMAVASLREQPA